MLLGDQVIESRFVPDKNLQIIGYMEGLQKDMLEQNEDIMDLTNEKPTFQIENFPIKKPLKN